jgi:hypothetical protein
VELKMDPLDRCLDDVAPLVDPARIDAGIRELAQIERPTDWDSFQNSARYLCDQFLAIGATCEILHFPADGRTRYGCWTAPIGYRTTRARCAIVAPEACAGPLGDRETEPNTAIVGTGHTGPEGVEGEVVHVEASDEIPAAGIAGKIVYCSRVHPTSIRQAVVEGGGLAIVSSYSVDRERNHRFVQWINTWDAGSDGWLPTAAAGGQNLPGISISPEMGDRLEACLAHGPVRLKVITEGAYFESELPGVWAVSAGTDAELVLLSGHLYEQGLIDNASGVTISLAVGEILRQLEARLGSSRCRRGLAHFHSQECYGALALAQLYPQRVQQAFAHLNLDMIGRGGVPLRLRPGLHASAGFSHALLRWILARAVGRMPAAGLELANTFQINDTVLAEPVLGGVSTSLLEQDNPEWHTSHDRVGAQELDLDVLRLATLAAAGWAYFLLSAGDREAGWLLGQYEREVKAPPARDEVADVGIYLALKRREMASLAVLASPEERDGLLRQVDRIIDDIGEAAGPGRAIVPTGTAAQIEESVHLYPKAVIGGPAVAACFTPDQLAELGSPKWSTLQLVLKSWADGTRSVYEIARLASYEMGDQLDLAYCLAFFDHYARQGIVTLETAAGA